MSTFAEKRACPVSADDALWTGDGRGTAGRGRLNGGRRTRAGLDDRPPPFPIIVGVAGHRDVQPEAEAAVRAAVRAVLAELLERFGTALHLMSSLTDGADQLVAEVWEALLDEAGDEGPLRLIAVAPMGVEAYRARLARPERFDHFWTRSTLKLALPDPAAEGVGNPDLQFEQLGVLLSRRSHLLLALWDGLPPDGPPRVRRGGAAAVVRMRRLGEDTLPGFRHSPLFPAGVSRLDLSQGGPVAQIVTPRAKTGGATGPTGAGAGDCFLLPGSDQGEDAAPTPVAPGRVCDSLAPAVRQALDQITRLNSQVAGFRGQEARLYFAQFEALRDPETPYPDGAPREPLARLRQWQAAADTAAQHFQRRLMGDLAPARSPGEMAAKGLRTLVDTRRAPHLGIVFGYAILVPIAVLLFETYAHLGRSPVALGLYLAVFAGGAAFYHFRVRRHELQNRFQDYRALAEALRVQLFWAAAATPEAAADSYLRKQGGELGWIQFALVGPALWAAAAALALPGPCRALVMRGWIDEQIGFFGAPGGPGGRAVEHAQAAVRSQRWARRFLFGGLTLSAVVAVIEVGKRLGAGRAMGIARVWGRLAEAQDLLLVAAITAPAVAAFFTVWVELRAYEAQAHSYDLMARIFDRARRSARAADDDEAFIAIVRDLGREALAETAEWLLDHRRRKIELKS